MPSVKKSSALNQATMSPVALRKPLLIASAWPPSGSLTHQAIHGWYLRMTSTVSSVEPPSTTINSRSGHGCITIERIVSAMNGPRLKEGMMMEMRGMGGTGCGDDVDGSHGQPDLPGGGGGKSPSLLECTDDSFDQLRIIRQQARVLHDPHSSGSSKEPLTTEAQGGFAALKRVTRSIYLPTTTVRRAVADMSHVTPWLAAEARREDELKKLSITQNQPPAGEGTSA